MEGLLVLEGHCVTFWLGQDRETGGMHGAHRPGTEAATREDGNPSRHILRGVTMDVRCKWLTVVAWDPHHEGSLFG